MTSPDAVSNGAASANGENGNHAREEKDDLPTRITDSPTRMSEFSDDDDDDDGRHAVRHGKQPAEDGAESGSEGRDEDGDESTTDEDEDEEYDEDDDDDEPSVKYELILGAVPDLLKKDSASALAMSNKLLVTPIYLLDFDPAEDKLHL